VTRSDRKQFREQLLEMARRISTDVASLTAEAFQAKGGEASGNLSNTPLHLADLGTDNFEQEMSLGFLESKTQIQQEVKEALDRFDEGRFGVCESCQTEIGRERLQAVPFARYCIECAQQAERKIPPKELPRNGGLPAS
jgi:RNA polymerase-binding transcription factor DksA